MSDWDDQIEDEYKKSQKTKPGKEGDKYQSLRNQAYTDRAMAEKPRKEAMANKKLSGAGGTLQTVQQSSIKNILSTLGGVNRQQQDYSDNVNLALAKLGTQYNSDTNSLAANADSDTSKEQSNWERSCGIQDRAQGLSEEDSQFERDKYLLKLGVITKKQFKRKWKNKK